MISNQDRRILFVGKTVWGGEYHDLRLAREDLEALESATWEVPLCMDLGYLGFEKYFKVSQLKRPHKKPRKSRSQPDPTLTEEQKQQNRQIAQVRIVVEHAIGRIKRYAILTNRLRTRCRRMADWAMMICAGLSNFRLKYAST